MRSLPLLGEKAKTIDLQSFPVQLHRFYGVRTGHHSLKYGDLDELVHTSLIVSPNREGHAVLHTGGSA
jgi:hypothetical protein